VARAADVAPLAAMALRPFSDLAVCDDPTPPRFGCREWTPNHYWAPRQRRQPLPTKPKQLASLAKVYSRAAARRSDSWVEKGLPFRHGYCAIAHSVRWSRETV